MASLADMAANHTRVSLTHLERDLLTRKLDDVAGLVVQVEEVLTVVAARNNVPGYSAFTEARLDEIRDAAYRLAEAVKNAPLDAD